VRKRAGARRVLAALTTLVILSAVAAQQPRAQGLALIRDAEIEQTLRVYSRDVFKAAGLDPEAISLHLVNADSLNAFVTPGRRMFFHTGLLRTAETPFEVIGVIAHETAHIASGDIAGRRQEQRSAGGMALTSALLGAGAAVLTGRGDVGAAVTSFGQGAALSDLLAYTRAQEGTADQAAVSYLNKAGYPPRGLSAFLEKLEQQSALLPENQAPFLRTHPLTRDRLQFLEEAVRTSPHHGQPVPEALERRHARMQAKLAGFLDSPERVLRERDGSTLPDRYARAIAHFREDSLDRALGLVDELLAEHPGDPYFHELKGQMLFENGRVEDALAPYQRAVELAPEQPLLRLALAEAQIRAEPGGGERTRKAVDHLDRVLKVMGDNPFAWRLAATAHGRLGDQGRAALALAESALAKGDAATARRQAERARSHLEKGSTAWHQASDVANEAGRRLEKRGG